MLTLKNLFEIMNDKNASDLHLSIGSPPRIRINGKLNPINENKLDENSIINLLSEYLKDDQLQEAKNGKAIDSTIGIPGLSRFRVNAFKQRGSIVATFRRLPLEVPNITNLGFSDTILKLTEQRKGLILITGGTGSGKSTTLATMVQKISSELEGHIITIEDPIEYLYPHSKSLINQREIGVDSPTFADALKSALRQDPDLVVVGELRDPESMATALTIAETGHLVLATLHTNNAAGTISRIVDVFPAEEKDMVRAMLSESLKAVISQVLCKKVGGGRVAAHEIMIGTPAIRNLIRENKLAQMYSAIQTGQQFGMQTLDQNLKALLSRNEITIADARSKAANKDDF